MPGTIALGVTGGLTEAEARKLPTWGKKQEDEMKLARELMQTCFGMYRVTLTGLAPEITWFHIEDPPLHEGEAIPPDDLKDEVDANWKQDYIVKSSDAHNLQRPETVESLFVMWRITGDVKYREWGWEIFEAFETHSRERHGAGFVSLNDVNELPPSQRDNMESFWLVRPNTPTPSHTLTNPKTPPSQKNRPKPSNTSTSSSPQTTSSPSTKSSSTQKPTPFHVSNSAPSLAPAGRENQEGKTGISSSLSEYIHTSTHIKRTGFLFLYLF
jgi:Glycosyl hydrolase family 47